MKRLLYSLVVFSAIFFVVATMSRFFGGGVAYTVPVKTADIRQGVSEGTRCVLPLPYSVGLIDPRFGVSETELLAALREAEAIWENALGRDIFAYDEEASLPVNLVYDERQARTDTLEATLKQIDTAEGRYEAAKKEYDAAVSELEKKRASYESDLAEWEREKKEYEADVSSYNNRLREYEANVAYWNARGGAPEEEYQNLSEEKEDLEANRKKLDKRRKELDRKLDGLERVQAELRSFVNSVNELAAIVNRLAAEVNRGVEVYNSNVNREPFITGLYTQEGASRSIDIYQFSDERELVLILAHELGHALGLGHVAAEGSIMYERVAEDGAFSDEDRRVFLERCD